MCEWLKNIGLEEYLNVFEKNCIKTAKDMEILKSFGRSQLETELQITKQGKLNSPIRFVLNGRPLKDSWEDKK